MFRRNATQWFRSPGLVSGIIPLKIIGWLNFQGSGVNYKSAPHVDPTLRVPLRVQPAHLPQAYILCSITTILSPLSEIIKATMGVGYFVTELGGLK